MLIVGELINASRKAVKAAIESQDADAIAKIASDEKENGADFVDVNAGVFEDKETEYLQWLVQTVQQRTGAACCIDSPNPKAIEAALALHEGKAFINSISLEKDRFADLLPVVSGAGQNVVALCMNDQGMPETRDQRLAIASDLVNALVKNDVPVEDIYVDPLVQPVSTKDDYGVEFLNAVEAIMAEFPGVHTICGLSNISFGLPERKLLNQAFVIMAIAKGLDAAVINPLDAKMMANIVIAETLAGKDAWCEKYLTAFREGRLGA